jgi:hypothetical protein
MGLISESWLQLKPNEELGGFNEDFNSYLQRIQNKRNLKHIPSEVLEQWIHPLHSDDYTLNNYAWLNFEEVRFKKIERPLEDLLKVNVIEPFQDHVLNRGRFSNTDDFCCDDNDIKHWKNFGTWRIPPIVLDVLSIKSEIPEWSEISPPFQLVEGHSRLGYLHSMKNISNLHKGKVAEKHFIYLMQCRLVSKIS